MMAHVAHFMLLQLVVCFILTTEIIARPNPQEYYSNDDDTADQDTVIESSEKSQEKEEPETEIDNAETSGAPESPIIYNIDYSVDPCENFYAYACNNWRATNSIPDDQSSYDPYKQLNDKAFENQRALFEENEEAAAARSSIGGSQPAKMARTLYRSCMDTDRLAQAKVQPMVDAMRDITALGTPLVDSPEFSKLMVKLARDHHLNVFWSLDINPDSRNSAAYIISLEHMELALGSRQYYSDKHAARVDALKRFIADVSDLYLEDVEPANPGLSWAFRTDPDAFVDFEQEFSKINGPNEDRWNKSQLFNLWSFAELKRNIPIINWDDYVDQVLPPEVAQTITDDTQIQIHQPKLELDFVQMLMKVPVSDVLNYIRHQLMLTYLDRLTERHRTIKQAFDEATRGSKTSVPRWKYCVFITQTLSRAVSAMYTDRYFTGNEKDQAIQIHENLVKSMEDTIRDSKWMDTETQNRAIEKLYHMTANIGYPDHLLDLAYLDDFYAELSLNSSASFTDLMHVKEIFARKQFFRRLLKPVDKTEMKNAYVVNAFYTPSMNTITIPAAILQHPFFGLDLPKVVNYGAVGTVMGHELTHGFDNVGAQHDQDGNLNNWWTDGSAEEFKARTKCIVDQYSSYEVDEVDLKVNGRLTQGENIADNGGVKIAHNAYMNQDNNHFADDEVILKAHPGLTAQQLFFVAFASNWCTLSRPERIVQLTLTNTHAYPEYRVIGTLSNFDEFANAFNCPVGSRMNPEKTDNSKCSVW